MTQSPYELFGIECGPGWKSLYQPLIERCQREGAAILQIKQKFGTLRFYASGCSNALFAAIDEAERRSAETCERCGAPGKTRRGSWMVTLCDACEDKRESTTI